MSRRFRVTANFPVLGTGDCHQVAIVEGSNWQVALGKAAREFKRRPIMHRRRVIALSMMVEQLEGQGTGTVEVVPDVQPVTEQTVMEMPTDPEPSTVMAVIPSVEEVDGERLNQQANDEAERLIEESNQVIEADEPDEAEDIIIEE